MDELLYGHDPAERIVSVQQKDDRTMRLYIRQDAGIRTEDAPFYPFFFLSDRRYIEGFTAKHWLKKLDGQLFYQYVCAFEEWDALWDAVRHVIDRYNRSTLSKAESYNDLDVLYLQTDPVAQYLFQSGKTLFKGMLFEDLHRLQLDLETYTSAPYRFSNAQRPGDRIILIALSDNRGWNHLIDGKKLREKEMLHHLVRIIQERDPDVIEGHNIYGFDIPYLLKRCELHGVTCAIGRDGSVPRTIETRTQMAERAFGYPLADIAGRHIVDTRLLVQAYDIGKRNMESYGLKYAAQYFGLASSDRTYIKGDQISWHWDHDPQKLMAYALDDVTETGKLSEVLSGTSFYLTQMLPHNYGQVARMGSAAKIESLLVRAYLRAKHSIPKPAEGTQTTGGYTDIFVTGLLGPILHADVESLYPSIMLRNTISPATDVLEVFRQLLERLTTIRLDRKRLMNATTEGPARARLDAMQSSLKILINSFYGYLGYSRGLFNDFARADEVTKTGQALLRQMIDHIQGLHGKVIEVDTDGVFFVPPESVVDEQSAREFVQALSDSMPQGISVALDGRYRKMLSYKKKNYALLTYEGKIRIKGSSLISRSMERFGRRYIQEVVDCLLTDNIERIHNLYTLLHDDIADHKLSIEDFARTETLKDSFAEYQKDVEAGKRNKSAAYEAAIATGNQYRPGDTVSYYITGNDPNPRSFEHCRHIEQWDPNFPDENVPYYLRRLDEFSEKFREFFEPEHFHSIFSTDSLFPFSAKGIITIVRDMREPSGPEEEPREDAGIWIDE